MLSGAKFVWMDETTVCMESENVEKMYKLLQDEGVSYVSLMTGEVMNSIFLQFGTMKAIEIRFTIHCTDIFIILS